MEKPTPKHVSDPVIHWDDIEKWIQHKTGRDIRDWQGSLGRPLDDKREYQDFWHFMLDVHHRSINRGSFFEIPLDPDDDLYTEQPADGWKAEVLGHIREEFGEYARVLDWMSLRVWVEW